MRALIQKLTFLLLPDSDYERLMIEYSLYCIITAGIQISTVLMIALFMGTLDHAVTYIISSALLKRTVGGWHANTPLLCFVVYVGLAITCSWIGANVHLRIKEIPLFISIWSTLIIFLLAPIPHPNAPRSKNQLVQYRKLSRLLSLIYLFSTAVTSSLTLALSGLVPSITLIMSTHFKERR